jgi:hypothetical protein
MDGSSNTVHIGGKKFLKCQQENCDWNIGWLGGTDWTEEPGKGTRICNLGARAIIETKTEPPDDCQQASAVYELARAEFEL